MFGYGELPETQEEWEALFKKMYSIVGTITGLDQIPPGLPFISGGAQAREGKMERELREDYGPITQDIDTSAILADKQRYMDTKPQPYVPKVKEDKPKKEMDLMEQAYLLSLMESMRGEDIGQAPAVVAGGGQRQWPSMMGQFRPWEQQKPYWWIT